ncbi:hypothetical protein IFR09_17065 [Pseudomonas syringae]|nr:hypothetical protein [Pseudomonas syringae]MBD8802299.1 hypothetical protein [Pseudomonas syringae]MBD8812876.1 hypothetical protein [Pseudomonas syringae]
MARTTTQSIETASVEVPVTETPATDLLPVAIRTRFRDTIYTFRTVVLPSGATVSVQQGIAVVDANSEALEYLLSHADFERLE